jgi:hypothetical protein
LYGEALRTQIHAWEQGDNKRFARIKVEWAPGDLLLFSGSLIHAGSRTYAPGLYTRIHFYYEPRSTACFGKGMRRSTNNYFYEVLQQVYERLQTK